MNIRRGLTIAILLALTTHCSCAIAADMPPAPKIDVYFSPRGGCTEAIVKRLNSAKESVLVQAYSFTSVPIAKAVVDAHKRGVKVQVVLDKSQRTGRYTSATFLQNSGVPVFIDDKHAIAHNKVMVIDGRIIITGSFNFSKVAEESNAENLLVMTPRLPRSTPRTGRTIVSTRCLTNARRRSDPASRQASACPQDGSAEQVKCQTFSRSKRRSTHMPVDCSALSVGHSYEIHGTTCKACGFDFDAVYGPELACSYIEIHHLRSITIVDGPVDPRTDLAPLCSNCHGMVHRDPNRIMAVEDLATPLRGRQRCRA